MPRSKISPDQLQFFLFLVFLPLGCHFAYSWIGYNPSDDGLLLAVSRRLLEGQVPHRDFITKTPLGTPLLHLPAVLFFGDATYWFSRLFVWFQWAILMWAWVAVIKEKILEKSNLILTTCLLLLGFTFSINKFPVMAWYTIDGVFFSCVGVFAALRKNPLAKGLGYLALGYAGFCKQNFFAVPFLFLILQKEGFNWRYLALIAAPFSTYALYLILNGAWGDFLLQMRSNSTLELLLACGFWVYLELYTFSIGVGIGLIATLFLFKPFAPHKVRLNLVGQGIGIFLLFLVPFYNAIGLMHRKYPAFMIMGVMLGMTLYLIIFKRRSHARSIFCAVMGLVIAWAASISMGFNSPALATGCHITTLLAIAFNSIENKTLERIFLAATAMLCAFTLFGFGYARRHFPYCDRPVAELTYDLTGVFPGMRFIKTSEKTFLVFKDLQRQIGAIAPKTYAIVPEFAGYWVSASQPNPLRIDWVWGQDLMSPVLYQEFLDDVMAQRGKTVFLVQKIDMMNIAEVIMEPESHIEFIRFLKRNFEKKGESDFFEVYE